MAESSVVGNILHIFSNAGEREKLISIFLAVSM